MTFLEPATFTAVQTYVPASSATALSIDRLPSLLRKIRPFRSTYKEEPLSCMNTDNKSLCNVLIKLDEGHITGFPLWDQYLSGRGIPSKSMQGIFRDWPMPVPMTAGPWAKTGGSGRKFTFRIWSPIIRSITTVLCQYVTFCLAADAFQSSASTNKSVFTEGPFRCASHLKVSTRRYRNDQKRCSKVDCSPFLGGSKGKILYIQWKKACWCLIQMYFFCTVKQ